MDRFVIEGGRPLDGRIAVSGSKNAALPILLAATLADEPVRIGNVPCLRDIDTTIQLLGLLGCRAEREAGGDVVIHACDLRPEAPYDLVRTMRASVLCLGPLLARLGTARVALPGGCAIGARPVDMHLKGLEKMGARFSLEHGDIVGSCPDGLHGAHILLDFPTVGGTENLIMAAVLADGETVIENAAREPEIVDLAEFLRACGARISGHGSSVVRIEGVPRLAGCCYQVMPDRIEAGTYLVAAGITRGRLELEHCPLAALDAVTAKLREMGMRIEARGDVVVAEATGPLMCQDVTTQPYPGFPTDMQAQIMALMTVSQGAGTITEGIFENRFMHVPELCRLGAHITLAGQTAVVRGVQRLTGALVMASDLRASACLVLAGLAVQGTTVVRRIYHLDRGYEAMERKLAAVGACIRREKE
ncbi:UDP-N-acetylglucosamine 1-carboxyvinyltransferase [Thermodesulfomicrobium sp. WS]|uniref:UDP-N-acetylglucosamine 1-carboxyvinyltransferase n=1 Tax=Thermodesulfomicrobium sp. WS TaxID=3004129 RepID=UPI00249141F4|nr:UDP-N-acetylglucosamine 1-carboxyvinyltransferase [Thermodesulfomicrobium sp. WS]BDV01573.1 UDP-N-acetylglucosamine 1-carboxyvinyltransferase [Thermodesulfomicrobium sp. WS]